MWNNNELKTKWEVHQGQRHPSSQLQSLRNSPREMTGPKYIPGIKLRPQGKTLGQECLG